MGNLRGLHDKSQTDTHLFTLRDGESRWFTESKCLGLLPLQCSWNRDLSHLLHPLSKRIQSIKYWSDLFRFWIILMGWSFCPHRNANHPKAQLWFTQEDSTHSLRNTPISLLPPDFAPVVANSVSPMVASFQSAKHRNDCWVSQPDFDWASFWCSSSGQHPWPFWFSQLDWLKLTSLVLYSFHSITTPI